MKIKIKFGFFACLLLLSIALTASRTFLPMICAIAVHELGHLFFARILKIKVRELKLGIFGARILPEGQLYSYRNEFLLSLGGPLFNIIAYFLSHSIFASPPSMRTFEVYSLSLAILNFLPIQEFDGSRMLTSLLMTRLEATTVEIIIRSLSFICIFTLWSISVYILMRISASLNLFIFSISLFARIFIPDIT